METIITTIAKDRIKSLFGFQFPKDFFDFYKFINKHLFTVDILSTLNMSLGSVFDVFQLDMEEEKEENLKELLKPSRYYNDPPEFVTVLIGDVDSLHWGYFFDKPSVVRPFVVNYYHSDTYEMAVSGQTLFEALRIRLEFLYLDTLELLEEDNDDEDIEIYNTDLQKYALIRELLLPYTDNITEIGDDYLDADAKVIRDDAVAKTRNHLGIIATESEYKKISQITAKQSKKTIEGIIKETRDAIKEGFPATALQTGQNLWTNPDFREETYEFLNIAYTQLKRPILIKLMLIAKEIREFYDARDERKKHKKNSPKV